MGIYDRDYYRDDDSGGGFLATSITIKLIVINVAIFVVDLLTNHTISDRAHLTANLFVDHPWNAWQLLTHGFLHDPTSMGHIVFNMLALWFFGQEVEGVYGRQAFLRLYLSLIVCSGLVWVLSTMAAVPAGFLSLVACIGASGAISGVLMLFVLHFPRRTILLSFIIPVPAWLFGILWIGADVMGALQRADKVAYSAHLGGAFFGFVYYKTGWNLFSWVPTNWRGMKGWSLPKFGRPKLRVFDDPDAWEQELNDKADAVLEKISRTGQESLSAEERRVLQEYSRRMQQKRR